MKNLINNADFNKITAVGEPENFSVSLPIKLLDEKLNGAGICTITMNDGIAADVYNPYISVQGKKALMFGMTVKTVDISKMFYVIEYFDSDRNPITVSSMDVSESVNHEFADIFVKAEIPQNTGFVKVRWDFSGKVTACRYCNPRLFAE